MDKKKSSTQRGSKKRTTQSATTRRVNKKGGKKRNSFSAAFSKILRRARIGLGNALNSLAEDAHKQRIFAVVLICVAVVGCVSFIVHQLTVKNAYAVFVAEEQIALFSKDKIHNADELYEQAVYRIESRVGSRVLVNEDITFELIHGAKKDFLTHEEVIQKIVGSLTYKVEAFIVYVEGTSLANLKSKQEAEDILKSIQAPYLQDGVNIIEIGFVENVRIETAYVEESEIYDTDRALRILTSTLDTNTTYRVVSGDNLSSIAAKAGMSFAEILAVNPGITPSTVLQIGDVLNITLAKPLISVRTVEQTSYIDVEPKPIQYLQNSNEKTSYQRTVQYGSVGQAEVICHTIRINGMESETVIHERVITVEPVPEIIEVGTR